MCGPTELAAELEVFLRRDLQAVARGVVRLGELRPDPAGRDDVAEFLRQGGPNQLEVAGLVAVRSERRDGGDEQRASDARQGRHSRATAFERDDPFDRLIPLE